ncbi:A disintegrin and metalloproteinase with thrombospondin motifs 12-like [Ischnura elegans]|uniref:A disintegrin and metalloproteinase with thrombospondin motifs 12-like n=1 Tax=Ischnura elegans TaxID=197161 RepID=UPI001ED88502|nr:A disintegrin and metalloproteinase with thrombospondin motifs 12-like [Ischnura elegans]
MLLKQNIIILCCYISAISCFSHGDSKSEWNRKYKKPEGRYTRHVEEYEIVVPEKVNEDSSFLSYDLPHYHGARHHHSYAENDEGHKPERRNYEEHGVHYKVKIGGKDYHLELLPNWGFISPNLVLEVRGKRENDNSSRIKIRTIGDEHNCFYNGVVRGQSNSAVALSLCDGLVGLIKTDEDKYFIEPLRGEEPMANGQYLHIIHKRGRDPTGMDSGTCGTSGDWEKAWKERLTRQTLLHMEIQNSTTAKRSTSKHNFIETLIVADRKFIAFHKEDSERYILTIMNMASSFFHDASIGNQIDICIVRIMFLETEKEELDLEITRDSEKTLQSFCSWQIGVNPKIDHPHHHDIAVLFTRHDLCSKEDHEGACGLLGLAYVAGVCDPQKSCSINEDNGLLLGVVTAHEIGHLMGCSHDDPKESSCTHESGNGYFYVMSPFVQLAVDKWSKCSQQFVTALLENGLGNCLANQPADNKFGLNVQMLPGAVYDADMQCSWEHGPKAKACNIDPNDFCERLFCKKDGKSCYTFGQPPADGTPCGSKKWCYEKKCVDVGSRPDAVNGGWGAWGPYSECTRNCGGGVSVSERECDNPKPNKNGRYCLGQRKRYKICNTKKCPPDKPTFRELQCTEKNSVEIKGQLHTWKPYFKEGRNPCELTCIHEGNKFMKLEPRVKDGTSCNPGTKDMCISGTCRKVGCDWELDSKAVEDVCGICNGDGTHCKLEEETYTKSDGRGYEEITKIPKLSTNILVVELGASENTLAMSSLDSKFYLNGDNKEERDGDFKAGKNTILVYSHTQPNKEKIMIKGPTTEDLVLYYVFYEPENPGIKVNYYKPMEEPERVPNYHWEFVQWEPCSVECGGGVRASPPKCIEEEAGEVSESFCKLIPKPETREEPCNTDPCTTRWIAGPWTKCTGCGGKKGSQSREVQCMKRSGNGDNDVVTDDDKCKEKPPKRKQSCVGEEPCERKRYAEPPKSDKKQNPIAQDPVYPPQHKLSVPIIEKSPKSHFSDETYEELGDQVRDEIDLKNAVEMQEENSKNEDGSKSHVETKSKDDNASITQKNNLVN